MLMILVEYLRRLCGVVPQMQMLMTCVLTELNFWELFEDGLKVYKSLSQCRICPFKSDDEGIRIFHDLRLNVI